VTPGQKLAEAMFIRSQLKKFFELEEGNGRSQYDWDVKHRLPDGPETHDKLKRYVTCPPTPTSVSSVAMATKSTGR
jgi:hypothetical protein